MKIQYQILLTIIKINKFNHQSWSEKIYFMINLNGSIFFIEF